MSKNEPKQTATQTQLSRVDASTVNIGTRKRRNKAKHAQKVNFEFCP